MTQRTFAHDLHRHMHETVGIDFKRAHIHELTAAALGFSSNAALLAEHVVCCRAPSGTSEQPAIERVHDVRFRARQLSYPDAKLTDIAQAVCIQVERKGLHAVHLDHLVSWLFGEQAHLYPNEADVLTQRPNVEPFGGDDDHAEDVGFDVPLVDQHDELSASWLLDQLVNRSDRGDYRVDIATALLVDDGELTDPIRAEADIPGRHWYLQQKAGTVLDGAAKEWADDFLKELTRNQRVLKHLERAADLGSADAMLLLAFKVGDQRVFELETPEFRLRISHREIADLAERLGYDDWAIQWLKLAAKTGDLEAMRDLIEKCPDDGLGAWTWYQLALLLGTDLTTDDHRAVNEDGSDYDDDVGGPAFVGGSDGVRLPSVSTDVQANAKREAVRLYSALNDSQKAVDSYRGRFLSMYPGLSLDDLETIAPSESLFGRHPPTDHAIRSTVRDWIKARWTDLDEWLSIALADLNDARYGDGLPAGLLIELKALSKEWVHEAADGNFDFVSEWASRVKQLVKAAARTRVDDIENRLMQGLKPVD